jgi:hypothetical protein
MKSDVTKKTHDKEKTMRHREWRRHRGWRGGITGPIILIGVGVIFLFHNLGAIPWGIGEIISRFWPVILILIGVDILFGIRFTRGSSSEQIFSEPVNGATMSEINIKTGINRLRIDDLADTNLLIEGNVILGANESFFKDLHRAGDTVYVKLNSHEDFFPWSGHWNFDRNWSLKLNREIPTRIKIHTGVGETNLNLAKIKMTDLDLNTGVGRTTLTLPERGQVQARIDGGVGEIYIVVPKGVAASIKVSTGIGAADIIGNYNHQGDLRVSPGFDTAENKVNLRIHGGVGRITVRET